MNRVRTIAWYIKPLIYTLEHILVSLRICKENRNYTKFVVISRSRTGSTLIDHTLRNHPNIESDGEILGRLMGRNLDWIVSNIFGRKRRKVRAVGFKIFYYHPEDDPSGRIWKLLGDIDTLKIIHLKRINILETYVSRKIAEKTLVWSKKKNKTERLVRLRIDPEDCISFFERTRNWERQFDKMFVDHDMLEVTYEELVSNFSKTMSKIQRFLSVPQVKISSNLKKQGKRHFSEKIENWEELQKNLEHTEWNFFLKEST